jgi:cellulose synthase/poly-beta-1,6-N-acetylglucosamine synthase-like glycosyltransferase
MTDVAASLAWLSLAAFVWSYLVYPPLIARLARRAARPAPETGLGTPPASAEVLVAAADEEGVIGARVRNLLEQAETRRVAVGCDGCRDGTAAAARAAGGERVRVVEFPARRGKASVLNDLVASSDAEYLVFTDANTRFEPGAMRALLAPFADARVGAVCGRLILESPGGATPEAALWDRETRTKEAEGALGVCVGANGAIYAARRALVRPLPPDTTSMDDFLIPAGVARTDARVVFAGNAVAREDAARGVAAEARRRFRIGIGAGQVLRREPWLFSPSHPLLALAFASRKAARWLAPLLALLAAAAALATPFRAAGAAALVLAGLLAASAGIVRRASGPIGRLYYFGVLNVALAAGVAAGLCGARRPAWTRTERA